MKKDHKIYLEHILEAINKTETYVRKLDKNDFLKNNLVQDGVVRNIEIIGEAVKNIPSDFKNRNRSIPWRDIAGMRDRIVHFYFGLDYELVWDTVKKDLPILKNEIKKLL